MDVTYRITNLGATATPNNFWRDGVFLSSDTVLDLGTDISLDVFNHGGPMAPGEFYERMVGFNLADGLAGDFHEIVQTDFEDRVFEGGGQANEVDNNLGFDGNPVTVESRPADLQIVLGSLQAPVSSQNGEAILVNWSMENVGNGPTLTGKWSDRISSTAEANRDRSQQNLRDASEQSKRNRTRPYSLFKL